MTHAQDRARERIGYDLKFWQLQHILKKLRSGQGTVVKQDDRCLHYLVRYAERNFRVVTNLEVTKMITVLRPGMR